MNFTPPHFTPQNNPPVPIERDAERKAEPVWEVWRKSLASSRESNPYSGRSPRSLAVPNQPGYISVISYFI